MRLFFLILLVGLLVGCSLLSHPPVGLPSGVEQTNKSLKSDSKTIIDLSTLLLVNIDEHIKTNTLDSINLARTEASDINSAAKRVFTYADIFDAYIKVSQKQSDTIIQLNEKLKKEKESAAAAQRQMLVLLFGLSLLGVATGVFLFVFEQRKLGSSVVIGSLALLAISIFITSYMWIFGLIGAIICLGGLVYLGYTYLENKKTTVTTNKELVATTELIKAEGWTKAIKAKISADIQSPETQTIVKQIRDDVKNEKTE